MKVHLIAIGGSAMHNLALALHEQGHQVTGSDDEIFEPSRSRLEKRGILPPQIGWYPEKITSALDAVILGMHATADNPELIRAEELGVKIYSYPEYLYEHSRNKKRVVIAGSHGKTTITSMILHVLKEQNMEFDFMVGAQIEGFDTMVRLSDAPVAIFEGDEYLTSPIDRRPKFIWYKPHIAVMSGIAWDHFNVFPTFDIYKKQFSDFLESMEDNGTVFYAEDDAHLKDVVETSEKRLFRQSYGPHPHSIRDNITYLNTQYGIFHIGVFGLHNLYNINAARLVCNKLGVRDEEFYRSIGSFKGAAKRLQILGHKEHEAVYLDFAHAPSKVTATVRALKEQFKERKLIACLELHTFSSLNKEFIKQYKGSMDLADEAYVFVNPEAAKHKKMELPEEKYVHDSFGKSGLKVIMDKDAIATIIRSVRLKNANLLLMSSGNFGGLDLHQMAKGILTNE
jgi:UDP-N-acetylmuramate: L-alanyl-gamma-D-glutamyl-meso-diaminopimelate ligase